MPLLHRVQSAGRKGLAFGYKPRRCHQDKHHDDREAVVFPPSAEFVRSPHSLSCAGHAAPRVARAGFLDAGEVQERAEAKLQRLEASAPPVALGRRYLAQLRVQVGPLAAYLSVLGAGQEAPAGAETTRCAPVRDTVIGGLDGFLAMRQ